MNAGAEIVGPAEETVKYCHISDEFPVIFLENAVGANGVNETSASWNRVNELQMEGSSPAILLMLSVNTLLFFSEQEPVEGTDDEVANDCDGIEQVMSSLHVDCAIRCNERVFTEVGYVLRS